MVFDLLKQRKNSEVILCRFDRASVRGLSSASGFLDLDNKSEEETARRILERLALNEGRPKNYYATTPLASRDEDTSQHSDVVNQAKQRTPIHEMPAMTFGAQLARRKTTILYRSSVAVR